jgi:arylsulfatase
MTYTTAHVRMPESSVINLKNCSYQITASIVVQTSAPQGVSACQGGNMAGWSLYIDEQSRPTFHYNWFGHEHSTVQHPIPLPVGTHEIRLTFIYDGGFGAGGTAVLTVDDGDGHSVRIERTVPLVFSMSGETFDVGMDTGSPVGPYPHQFPCTEEIVGITLQRLNEPPKEILEKMREGEFRASISTQ